MGKYILEKLPYDYDALEPYIDKETMIIHHSKHHQGYVDKLNAILENAPQLGEKDLEDILRDVNSLPENLKEGVVNFGGGVYNHNLFWLSMAPVGSNLNTPQGQLKEALVKEFGSYDEWWRIFAEEANKKFGSGWVWLVKDKNNKLKVVSTSNQDNPLSYGYYPLLGLDVWEHAYYLKYQNRRNEYVSMWKNIIDWKEAIKRFEKSF